MADLPSNVINQNINARKSNGLYFPEDIHSTSVNCTIREFEYKPKITSTLTPKNAQAASLGFANVLAAPLNGTGSLGALIPDATQRQNIINAASDASGFPMEYRGQYLLPVPMVGLQDSFQVMFNDHFEFLPIHAVLNNLGLGGAAAGFGIGAAQAASGIYLNTFKSVTLDAPQFRNFQLQWKFSPKNATESRMLQQILYRFRKNMTPDTVTGGGKFLFKFPFIYWVGFSNAQYMYKTKPAVIKDMTVDYAGGTGIPSFFKGTNAPESIVLTLQFLELEYWTKRDYDGGELPTSDQWSTGNAFTTPENNDPGLG